MNWDEKASVRERLYLLYILTLDQGCDPTQIDPSAWMYNSRTDRWSNGRTGVKVDMEASESLAMLKQRTIDNDTALRLVADTWVEQGK
jgi:hypothetical protein